MDTETYSTLLSCLSVLEIPNKVKPFTVNKKNYFDKILINNGYLYIIRSQI